MPRRIRRVAAAAPRSAALLALGLAALATGCAVRTPLLPGPLPRSDCEGAASITHSAFLIGDAGAPRLPRGDDDRLVDPVLLALQREVTRSAGELGAVRVLTLFLGDNVYPRGLPPPSDRGRRRGERVLRAQIAAAASARAVFLAGNHDWAIEGPEGWRHVNEQRAFLAAYAPAVTMLPPGGCAGPERLDLGPHLRFVLLDQVGWYHALTDPEEYQAACGPRSAYDIFLALAEEFDRPEGRHVVLAVHHPLITAGPHGGYYTWKQHLFPLTDFVPWLWVPLPVVGSLYPISRQLGVTRTDVTSESYRRYQFAIYRAARPRVPMLVAAGHEHSLQLHRDAVGMYYAVSGAGSVGKVDRVEPTETSMLAAAEPGFMRLDAHADGALGLTAIAVDRHGSVTPIYRHCLATGPPAP